MYIAIQHRTVDSHVRGCPLRGRETYDGHFAESTHSTLQDPVRDWSVILPGLAHHEIEYLCALPARGGCEEDE